MDAIYRALDDGELTRRAAVEAVLRHHEFGGNLDDAEALVDEWIAQQNDTEFPDTSVDG